MLACFQTTLKYMHMIEDTMLRFIRGHDESEIIYYPGSIYYALSIFPRTPSPILMPVHLLRLLKQIMTDPPRIPSVPPEQLRTSQIEDLPPIPPRQRAFYTIRLHKPLPNTLLIAQHGRQPVLTRLTVVHTTDPPLPLQPEIVLEEKQ